MMGKVSFLQTSVQFLPVTTKVQVKTTDVSINNRPLTCFLLPVYVKLCQQQLPDKGFHIQLGTLTIIF